MFAQRVLATALKGLRSYFKAKRVDYRLKFRGAATRRHQVSLGVLLENI